MQYVRRGKGVQRCPQCGSMMHEQTDKEQRRWAVCWQCKAQIPVDDGLRLITKFQKKVYTTDRE